jgi:hypothetical protein
MCNYIILNNNKYCATSSCGSNGISYGSAYLCYTIRNNHNNNSIRVEYSVNGTAYQSSNSFAGLAPGVILYMSETFDPSCVTMSGSTTTINSIPPPPVVPTTASVTQPTCAVQSGSISVTTQSGVEYSLDGTYQASNTFSGLTRMIILYMFRAPVIILV